MTARPWYRRFPGDYRVKTLHLTPGQHGAYILLLDECYLQADGTIPNDHEWIRRRLGWTEADYDANCRPVIAEFFTVTRRQRLTQKRVREEVKEREKFYCVQQDRARKRWKNKQKKDANARAMPTRGQCQPTTHNKIENNQPIPSTTAARGNGVVGEYIKCGLKQDYCERLAKRTGRSLPDVCKQLLHLEDMALSYERFYDVIHATMDDPTVRDVFAVAKHRLET